MKKNEITLTFNIYDFDDITHDEISNKLELKPTSIRVKGDRKNPGNMKSPVIEVNRWSISSGLEKNSDFDAHMDALLNILESKVNALNELSLKYPCEISCGMFVYFDNGESTPWVHLNERYHKVASKVKLEFNLDLYILHD